MFAVALLPSCTGSSAARTADGERPARPPACQTVAPSAAGLQAVIDQAPAGAVLCLDDGRHTGPLRITRPLTLWGGPGAVIVSGGNGTTIDVAADGVTLAGFGVDGSGSRFDLLDAAVRVHGADVVIDGLDIRHATFGILTEKSRRVTVRGNRVAGNPAVTVGMRGDSIRLWETTDSVVEDNQVNDGRDLVVWYSARNHIRRNRIRGARYGTHLMYSSDCTVEDNRYERVVVGTFVMYSHRVAVTGNRVAGASEMGLGLKDAGDIEVRGNGFVHAAMGLYLDGLPPAHEVNRITGNAVRMCDSGIVFHSSGDRIELAGNELADNRNQVVVEGGGDALGMTWDGNYYDDYAGYDLDGDGIGDVPHQLRSVSGQLIGRYPNLAYFEGAPSLELADAITRMVPLLEPQTLLIDEHPLVESPHILESLHAY
jgi:nitrous oxidase accessory protein